MELKLNPGIWTTEKREGLYPRKEEEEGGKEGEAGKREATGQVLGWRWPFMTFLNVCEVKEDPVLMRGGNGEGSQPKEQTFAGRECGQR